MHITPQIATPDDALALIALVNSAYRPALGEGGWTDESLWVRGQRINQEQMLGLFVEGSVVLTLWGKQRLLACVHVQNVLQAGKQISGTCGNRLSVENVGQAVYIGMLATLPECQGLGLGKRMLAFAEQYAVAQFNATSFKMSVLAPRCELLAFYARRGYLRTGQRDDFPLSAGVGQPLYEGLKLEILAKAAPMPVTIVPACFPRDLPEVIAIFREYVASPTVSLDFQNFEVEFANLPGKYAEPEGQVLFALQGGVVVGCAALRPVDSERCELKRVYVRPMARGQGIGRQLIELMIEKARLQAYKKMCLDVLPEFIAAEKLYGELGFVPDEAVGFNPVPGTKFLSLVLLPLLE